MHGDATMQKITACLWFNDQAEEAARFYPSIFTHSAIGAITHDGEGSPRPTYSVLTGRFQLHGQAFLGLNGGPQFCQVDDQLAGLPKHPESHLWPSEVVTLGLLHALKGVGNRPFYRWLTRDYRV